MPKKTRRRKAVRPVRLNSNKMFLHRHSMRFDLPDLATKCGIPLARLEQLESGVNCPPSGPTERSHFPIVKAAELKKLEKVLTCPGILRAGRKDDFSTHYIAYRKQYYGTQLSSAAPSTLSKNWKAKAVIFDFDGTLTKPGSTQTTWEALWQALGYNDNECGLLAHRFFQRQITHSEWCQLTLEKFRAKKLTLDTVKGVAKRVELIRDFDDCMMEIKKLQIPTYIVSGSVWDVVSTVLGERAEYFKRMEANAFGYNADNTIGTITGTRFDFEGKGDFVREVAKDLNVLASDILFVGNSISDVHVKATGAKTLLVNPHLISADPKAWDFYIPRMRSLLEVLPYVDSSWEARNRESAASVLKDLDELRLSALSVLGKYRRFSNAERATLVSLADRIRRALCAESGTRENFLIYAAPGSGKTFFVEELATEMADRITFVAIDLSRDDSAQCKTKLAAVAAATKPSLCMIDEVDGRKGEDWPYDLIYKYLDLNEDRSRAAVVFVLIGSSGGSVKSLSDVIRSRYKGKDMIDRILESDQHWAEIPPLGKGDTVCVYASKMLEAAAAVGKQIKEVEKFAAYHAAVTCRTPRQIKLLADQAVRRIPDGHTQVKYDHHFEAGAKTNRAFRDQHSEVASAFENQCIRISE